MRSNFVVVTKESELLCETRHRKVWRRNAADHFKTQSVWHDGTTETRTLSAPDTVTLLQSIVSELEGDEELRIYDIEALLTLLGAKAEKLGFK